MLGGRSFSYVPDDKKAQNGSWTYPTPCRNGYRMWLKNKQTNKQTNQKNKDGVPITKVLNICTYTP